MDWLRGRAIIGVGVAVLAGGAWWGLVRDTGDTGPPARGGGPLVLDQGELLDLVPGCRRDTCRVVDRRDGFRLDGRRVALLAVAHPEPCRGQPRVSLHFVVPTEVVWSSEGELCGDPVRGIVRDATGHAFLTFAPGGGRASLVVLAVGESVADFGSLEGRFAGEGVSAEDTDGDGAREITVDGRVWRWDGADYVEAEPGSP